MTNRNVKQLNYRKNKKCGKMPPSREGHTLEMWNAEGELGHRTNQILVNGSRNEVFRVQEEKPEVRA